MKVQVPAIFWAVFTAGVHAATIYVPDDQPTIQAGIDAASLSDTILVAPGVYTGDGNRNVSFYGKNVVVKSESGPEVTTIDCNGPYRAFVLFNGEDSTAVIDGFTVTGATLGGADSGAVMCHHASATIKNCVVTNNACNGFWGFDAAPHFENCVFSHNRNGFVIEGSFAKITGCEFSFNDSNGVAIEYSGGVEMSNCLVRDNAATGLWIYTLVDPFHVSNCTFVNNRRGFYYALNFPKSGSYSTGQPPDTSYLRNCIVAFNQDIGIEAELAYDGEIACCDAYGNPGGDFVPTGPMTFGPGDAYGDISADPLFCDTAAGDFRVAEESPCSPLNNTCAVLMGAFGAGCGCCQNRGNVDGQFDGEYAISVSDVTYLVAYLFGGGPAPPCEEEGNVDALLDGGFPITVSDLTYLVSYLFDGGPSPPPCSFDDGA